MLFVHDVFVHDYVFCCSLCAFSDGCFFRDIVFLGSERGDTWRLVVRPSRSGGIWGGDLGDMGRIRGIHKHMFLTGSTIFNDYKSSVEINSL